MRTDLCTTAGVSLALALLVSSANAHVRWCTYLGTSGTDLVHFPNALATTADGLVVTAGRTNSALFPTTADAYDTTHNGGFDVYVTVFDPNAVDDAQLIYSTYLGGPGYDYVACVVVDVQGRVILAGSTNSAAFPVTPDAYDATYNGAGPENWGDAFIAVLDITLPPADQLVYSTYIGSPGDDHINDFAVSEAGSYAVLGMSFSAVFPTTPGAYDTTINGLEDAVVFVFDRALVGTDQLVSSTFLGGSLSEWVRHVAIHPSGDIVVATQTWSSDYPTTPGAYDTTFSGGDRDGSVSRLDPTLSTLLYSTFIGGSGDEALNGMDMDSSGNVVVAGWTYSADYPTTPGAYDESFNSLSDVFVTRLDPTLSTLEASTFIGGSFEEGANGVLFDGTGGVTVSGATNSMNYPVDRGGLAGAYDVFVSHLDRALSTLQYSLYVGGGVGDVTYAMALSGGSDVVFGGWTSSSNFPTTPGAYDQTWNGGTDACVGLFDLCKFDLDGDGEVGVTDFLQLLADWGSVGVPADFDGGGVGVTDFLILIGNWGPCP